MRMSQQDIYRNAVQRRDAEYDAVFCYGVLTTGIYCKPSCKARQALRRNVRFFESAEAAERAGLRACKKCGPKGEENGIEPVIHALCRYIETHVDETLSLAHIAKKAGYSAAHLQKAFTARIGSSPKAYQSGLRRERLKAELTTAPNVTQAIYGAGYGAPSRVYEKLGSSIGMTPKQYREGGAQVRIHYAHGMTRLGVTLIGATERGICFLQFGEDAEALRAELKREFPEAVLEPMPQSGAAAFNDWMEALNAYLDEKKTLNALPLDLRGTAFQLLVWRYLQTIPAGEVRSYTEVAAAIGKPSAVRAVASACAKNRLALLVPCHRVLRGDGQLAGYRWGLPRKRALLDLERRER